MDKEEYYDFLQSMGVSEREADSIWNFQHEPGLEQVEFPSMSLIKNVFPSLGRAQISKSLGYRYHDKPKDPRKTVERHRIEEIERMMHETGQPKEAVQRKLKQLEQIEHDKDAIASEWRRHNDMTNRHYKDLHHKESLNHDIPMEKRIENRRELHGGHTHEEGNRGH